MDLIYNRWESESELSLFRGRAGLNENVKSAYSLGDE